MPKVSVITPIYRTEKDLDKCLKSLVAQTLPEIEFLWIDNGASDECRQIIQKYADKREGIRVITLKENIGYCGAMNKGLSLATGDYIGFCDSDDYVDVDYYENLYKKAHETDSEIVYCGCIVENEKTGRVKYSQLRFSERNDLPLLEHLNTGTNWNGLFLRDFINENKLCFPTSSSSIYKDICFSAPAILKAKRTAITTEVFYHYVIHDKSTTIGISKKQHCQAIFEVLKEIGEKITPPFEMPEKSFIRFLFRALSLGSLDSFPQEISFLSNTPLWQDLYKKQRTFSNPTWRQRLFSVSRHLTKPIIKIRILGISFKIKKKEKKS